MDAIETTFAALLLTMLIGLLSIVLAAIANAIGFAAVLGILALFGLCWLWIWNWDF